MLSVSSKYFSIVSRLELYVGVISDERCYDVLNSVYDKSHFGNQWHLDAI